MHGAVKLLLNQDNNSDWQEHRTFPVIPEPLKCAILWPSWNKNLIYQNFFDVICGICCHVTLQLFLRNFRDHQQAKHSIHIHQLYFLHISWPNIAYTYTNCIFLLTSNPNIAYLFINCIFYTSESQTQHIHSTVFAIHQQAKHSIPVHQLHLLHTSNPNIAYMFKCIFYTSASQT